MYGNWVNAIPSRFVDELPPETVDAKSEGGLYNPGRSAHWDSKGLMDHGYAPRATREAAARTSSYKHGDEVYHSAFGRGRVVHIDGLKLDILFEDGESRRVMENFVDPA
jgi:DNA helicase-2/ATP-dependent DNA helicase PcrA